MTAVKFDVTLDRDGDTLSRGCQTFSLADVVGVKADKVEIEQNRVTLTGAVLEVTRDGYYSLPNGERVSRGTLRDYVRNLTDMTPPAPAWQDGDAAFITNTRDAKVTTVVRQNGVWVYARNGNRWAGDDTWLTDTDHSWTDRTTVVVRGGQAVSADTSPRVDQYDFRVGDRVRINDQYTGTSLRRGVVYTISRIEPEHRVDRRMHIKIYIAGHEGVGFWWPYRFDLVTD